jgi:hypothetical protein
MAIEDNVPVQRVDYPRLRARLLADKQILDWQAPAVPGARGEKLEGIVIDDLDARREGEWIAGSSLPFRAGSGYSHDADAHKGELTLIFTPEVPKAGNYDVVLHWPPASNRATKVPVTVSASGQPTKTVHIDQKTLKGSFALGTFQLSAGRPLTVTVSNRSTSGHVVVDALQLVPAR